MGFPGRLLNDGEHVVLTTRAHGKALTAPVVVLLLTTFLAAFAAGRVGRELTGPARAAAVGAVALLAAVVVARRVVVPFLRWLSTTHTVTDRRYVARSGVLAREGRTVPLDRVTAIDVERSVLDRLFGCGTLVVSDGSEEGRFALHDVPRVEEVQRCLTDEVHRSRHEPARVGGGQRTGLGYGEEGTGDLRIDHRP